MKRLPLILLCLTLVVPGVLPCLGAQPGVLTGKVVSIADGDTLTVLVEGDRQVKVRLAQIDTPERGAPWSERARQALAERVFGKTVTVQVVEVDRYGRSVGTVYLDGMDVNAEMVRRGHAWVYRRYATDPALLDLERAAREQGLGLWSLPEADRLPPWEWRRNQRHGTTAAPGNGDRHLAAFTCGEKRYCRQMTSCAEARFHLSQCGLASLDGDDDGTPCEQLCR